MANYRQNIVFFLSSLFAFALLKSYSTPTTSVKNVNEIVIDTQSRIETQSRIDTQTRIDTQSSIDQPRSTASNNNIKKTYETTKSNVKESSKFANTPELKHILYWNDFYGSKNYGFCCGRNPYKKQKCPNTNCVTAKFVTQDIETYDAIVFHQRTLDKSNLPTKRSPSQLYIFLSLESAAYPENIVYSDWDNFFNISMTFRQDSQIVMPYGKVQETKISKKSEKSINEKIISDINHKTTLAGWFVSHCQTVSRREELVTELSLYLAPGSVEIYGKCSKLKCPQPSSNQTKEDCWKMAEKKYKFYLSLENSLCKDYVTEKLFEALKYNIVPIVLGGANYSSFMPPNSYIDMSDFSNMKELASYLQELDTNMDMYLKYFDWKTSYQVLNSKRDFNNAHCDLCQFLHHDNQRTRVIDNLHKYWLEDSNCKNNKFYYNSQN